ncbi:DUF4351 domain-containing protein [Methylohalobius crimeensis]|uniref:DUF4351 domain-containing protein n=1 Tax=Methylohalobius crimeensis TaxID=244365 RepID=UPI0003B57043|nr:DUF4351 domain-containing protein [Methylohalobius crimeensis]
MKQSPEMLSLAQTLFAYEQEKHMPYVTSIEQMGLQKGRLEGRQEGEAAVLLRLLERQFGPVDEAVRERLARADDATLLHWCERVLTAETLEEVWLESRSDSGKS